MLRLRLVSAKPLPEAMLIRCQFLVGTDISDIRNKTFCYSENIEKFLFVIFRSGLVNEYIAICTHTQLLIKHNLWFLNIVLLLA